jgi:leucyl-tRNA synthetase
MTRLAWPEWDPEMLREKEVTIVVQVNGKKRGEVTVAADADEATVTAAALAEHNVRRFVEGKQVRKTILVPGKLVNVVVG